MRVSLVLRRPAMCGAFRASPFVAAPARAAALACVRQGERTRTKRKFLRGWLSSINKDQVEAYMAAPDLRKLADPTTGWDQSKRRAGVIARKLGMVSEYTEYMQCLPTTVLQIVACQVVQVKREQHNVYEEEQIGIQVGAANTEWKRLDKSERGHFFRAGVPPKKVLMEFKVSPDAVLPIGLELRAEHFVPGQYLDITGKTKGKGFQGVMKRWGFSGGPASHGASLSHRTPGSIGQHSIPSKVWKGKKMPGRMGNKYRTVKNAFLWKIDTKQNLLYIRGAIPGPPGSFLRVRDAKNKLHELVPPYPTYIRQEGEVPPEVITANSPEPVWFKKMMARRAAFAEDPSKNLDDDQTAVQAILDHKEQFPSYDKWKKGLLPPGRSPSTHYSCRSFGESINLKILSEMDDITSADREEFLANYDADEEEEGDDQDYEDFKNLLI